MNWWSLRWRLWQRIEGFKWHNNSLKASHLGSAIVTEEKSAREIAAR
jgi:hypothetical protein